MIIFTKKSRLSASVAVQFNGKGFIHGRFFRLHNSYCLYRLNLLHLNNEKNISEKHLNYKES